MDSDEFLKSIEMTTKSSPAISTRLQLWGEALRQVTGLDFNIPQYKDRRIYFEGFW